MADVLPRDEPFRAPTQRPIRGRQPELSRLEACLAALGRTDAPPLLVIEGDAGMGKSRLVAELASLGLAYDIRVVVSTCDSIARDRPFGPILGALGCEGNASDDRRRAIAERAVALGPVTTGEHRGPAAGELAMGARYGVQDQLVDLILEETDSAPLVIVIDDAHWIDPASMATISAVLRRRSFRPLTVVLALRSHPRPIELESLLHDWHEDLEIVRVSPLPPSVTGQIAGDVLGRRAPQPLLDELERAGGNPFSVIALTRGFAQKGYAALEGVRTSVLTRVNQLGADALRLLGIAAVLGVDFTPETLAVLGERSRTDVSDVLYDATRAGLLVSRGQAFAFNHSLIAEQLIADMPEALRASMHRSIVHNAPQLDLGATTVAHHAMVVSMPGDLVAIHALCMAASQVAGHDPELALAYLEHGAQLCHPGCELQTEVALRRAGVLCSLKRVNDAMGVLEDALTSEKQTDRIAELRAGQARCAHLLGNLTTAANTLEGLARSGLLAPAAEAAAWADVATYRFWLLQGDHPWEEADRAVALADAHGIVAPAVQAIAAQATMAAFTGDVSRALDLAAQAAARGSLLPHDQVIPSPGFTAGLVRMLADDLAGSIDVLQRDQLRIERLGDPLLAVRPATALLIARYLAGQWDDALAEARAIGSICADTGSAVGRLVAPVITGLIAHHRGDDSLAELELERARTMTESAEAYALPFLFHLEALRLERAGQRDEAASSLVDSVAIARAVAAPIGTWFAVDAARMILDLGSPQPALVDRLLDGLEPTAQRVRLAGGIAFAAIVTAALRHQPERALASVEAARRSPHMLTRSTALELAGRADRREASTAQELLAEARSGYDNLAATPHVHRIVSLLDADTARSLRPRRERARFGWEALTPAELAVLEMVLDAKPNGEIAEQLFLSKRTVESHVSSMLVKLGVRTRIELVVAAGRRNGESAVD